MYNKEVNEEVHLATVTFLRNNFRMMMTLRKITDGYLQIKPKLLTPKQYSF